MMIRKATTEDFEQIWPIFEEVASAGETYAYPQDISKEDAFHRWMTLPRYTYVAEEHGKILGTYYLRNNQDGPGKHVCNCGYMVASHARGQGVARKMGVHSKQQAVELGYQAMQFNCVVSSNAVAIKLWKSLGFEIAGTLPKAFEHPSLGFIDAFVMYQRFVD